MFGYYEVTKSNERKQRRMKIPMYVICIDRSFYRLLLQKRLEVQIWSIIITEKGTP